MGVARAKQESMQGMSHMAGHMYMTTLRPVKPGDQQKADAIAADAKKAMEPYRDYHKALADGYEIFLPNVPQPQYHFTKAAYGLEARNHFDPLKPTSLAVQEDAGRRVQAGGCDVHGPCECAGVRARRADSDEHCAVASAYQFLQGTGCAGWRVHWAECEVRSAGLDHDERGV